MQPYYEHAGITIYHGDCNSIAGISAPDLVLTDPPYGIGASTGIGKYGRLRNGGDHPVWDLQAPSLAWLAAFPYVIVWGGNYFALPPSRMFLVWDKGAGFVGRDFAECEQAWCSWDGNAKMFHRDPLARRDYIGKEHPTEKPIPLMAWCIGQCPRIPEVVLDPYCGSGSTLVAAKQLGIAAVGIEIEERYCEIAAKRLSQEVMAFE